MEEKNEHVEETPEQALERIINKALDARLPKQEKPEEKVEDAWKHVHDCPECKKKLDAEKEQAIRENFLKTKDYELECTNCGTPIENEKTETCPTCKGTRVRKRR